MMLLTPTTAITERYIVRAPVMDDLEAVVSLLNICSVHTVGQAEFSLEEMHSEWTSPGYNLETDSRLVITPDGLVVGYVEVHDHNRPVSPWLWARVHPEYEGQGIGTFIMEWAEQRARQAIAKAPEGARVIIEAGADHHYAPPHQLFRDLGMMFARQFWKMQIVFEAAPPEPVWPEGIQVRTMIPGQDERALYQARCDTFKDHYGYVEAPFEEGFATWRHYFIDSNNQFDPSVWFLAMDGDQIAGFAVCTEKLSGEPERAWINTLGVLRPWRRKGLALALLHQAFGEFYRRGQRLAGLAVDGDSLTGATRLYEKAGMTIQRRFDEYEKELRPGADTTTRTLAE